MLCALGVIVVVVFGLQAALFLDPEVPLAPASWAVLSVCVWLLFVLSKGGWSQLSTNDTRRFAFGIFAAVLFLHYLQLDPDFKGWSSVYYFCGQKFQFCTCDFRWNIHGWLKAVVLWQFVLSATLGAQQLVIQAGLGGLLPGEEAVTRESFVSICWRLIPYWLNNWEQQWGAEVSSMTFELPHFTVELLIILPCCQIICSRLKVLVTPQVNVLLGPAAGAQGGAEEGAFVREEFAPNVLQGFWERRPEQRRFLPRVRANIRVLAFLVGLTALAALNATLVPLYLEGQAAGAPETPAVIFAGKHIEWAPENHGPALQQLRGSLVAQRLQLYTAGGGGGRGCPSATPFVANAKKHATELLRMQDPEHRSLIPLVESALAIMRLSCEKYFVLVAIYLAFLLFRDAPRPARAVIRLVARVSGIFQKVILFAFPALCWLYNAGVVFSIFVSVVFWGGPLLALYDTARAMLREVTIKGLSPATAEQVDRMGGTCAICWGDMAAQSDSLPHRQAHKSRDPQHGMRGGNLPDELATLDTGAQGASAGAVAGVVAADAASGVGAGSLSQEAAAAGEVDDAAAGPSTSSGHRLPPAAPCARERVVPVPAGGLASDRGPGSATSGPGSRPCSPRGQNPNSIARSAAASGSGGGGVASGMPDNESLVAEAGSVHPADVSSSCGRGPGRPSSTGSFASVCCSSASAGSLGGPVDEAALEDGSEDDGDDNLRLKARGRGGRAEGRAGAAPSPAASGSGARSSASGEAGDEREGLGGAAAGAGGREESGPSAAATATGESEAKSAGWALPCGHAYHHACLSQWMEQCSSSGATPTCPMCQRGIQLQVRWRPPPLFGRRDAAVAGGDFGAGGTARIFGGRGAARGAAAAAAAAAGAGGAGGRFVAPGAGAAAAAADLAAGEDLLNAVRHFAGHDAGLQVVGLLEHQRELQELLHEPPALEFGELLRDAQPLQVVQQQQQQQQEVAAPEQPQDPALLNQQPEQQRRDEDWAGLWPVQAEAQAQVQVQAGPPLQPGPAPGAAFNPAGDVMPGPALRGQGRMEDLAQWPWPGMGVGIGMGVGLEADPMLGQGATAIDGAAVTADAWLPAGTGDADAAGAGAAAGAGPADIGTPGLPVSGSWFAAGHGVGGCGDASETGTGAHHQAVRTRGSKWPTPVTSGGALDGWPVAPGPSQPADSAALAAAMAHVQSQPGADALLLSSQKVPFPGRPGFNSGTTSTCGTPLAGVSSGPFDEGAASRPRWRTRGSFEGYRTACVPKVPGSAAAEADGVGRTDLDCGGGAWPCALEGNGAGCSGAGGDHGLVTAHTGGGSAVGALAASSSAALPAPVSGAGTAACRGSRAAKSEKAAPAVERAATGPVDGAGNGNGSGEGRDGGAKGHGQQQHHRRRRGGQQEGEVAGAPDENAADRPHKKRPGRFLFWRRKHP